jgi:hypothetical protein
MFEGVKGRPSLKKQWSPSLKRPGSFAVCGSARRDENWGQN